jgi:hypothetical protein
MTATDYEANLEANLGDLLARIKSGYAHGVVRCSILALGWVHPRAGEHDGMTICATQKLTWGILPTMSIIQRTKTLPSRKSAGDG